MENEINQSLVAIRVIRSFFHNLEPINYQLLDKRGLFVVKGVLRWHYFLRKNLSNICRKKPKNNSLTEIILLVGIFQVYFMRFKPRNEILNAAQRLGLHDLKNFFNAVIKKCEQINPVFNEIYDPSNILNNMVINDWPDYLDNFIYSSLSEPENTIRIFNDKFVKDNRHNPYSCCWIKQGNSITLNSEINPCQLEGFASGDFYIQGFAAQQISLFLENKENQNVLDACCGAGGKFFIAKQLMPASCKFTVNDINPKQLKILEKNCKRLNIYPDKVTCMDFLEMHSQEYDFIILDVPCTASGNINKYPEIRFRINDSELKKLLYTQARILEHAWNILRPNGCIVYMTCSILKAENEEQIIKFLLDRKNAREEVVELKTAVASKVGQQILAREHNSGFFYCKIRKLES